MSKKNIIPIFVPHLGCPNDCVFCNQKKIASASTNVDETFLIERIEEYLSYFKDKSDVEIAFYGGSFTAIELSVQNSLLKIAKKYKDRGIVKSIRLSTRPDCIDEKILNNLKNFCVDTIELGVQSLDENVLKFSNRGHNSKCVYESSKLIKDSGFKLGLQQMIGLPGDNKELSYYTACEFKKIGPEFVRIYPTLVIAGTKMAKDYESGKYIPLSLEDTIHICKELLKFYILNDIDVIRIGLQPTDNIRLGADVVAGPFHPSIRQLVSEELLYDFFVEYFKNIDTKDKVMTVYCSNKNISNIAGQKKSNKNKINEELDLRDIKLKFKNLSDYEFIISLDGKEIRTDIREHIKTEIKCT
ncbi:radical SAM domain protein [Peptoniphilus sp. ING2-D1G]|nr:radical SAM domain protein [Peptoniphilus sp. ING2-D1G]